MIVLWLGTILLTVFPELHHWLHADAQVPHHQCVVTLVQHQFVLGPAEVLPTQPPIVQLSCESLHAESPALCSTDYRVSPSRAPPVPLAFPTVVG